VCEEAAFGVGIQRHLVAAGAFYERAAPLTSLEMRPDSGLQGIGQRLLSRRSEQLERRVLAMPRTDAIQLWLQLVEQAALVIVPIVPAELHRDTSPA
jgi:hypothetical protein